jgi:hypothetical protein
MLLFQKRFHAGLLDGSTTLTFRRWAKPLVRAGGRYRCHPIGVLEVVGIDRVQVAAISEGDARRAGFAGRSELVAYLASAKEAPLAPDALVHRVELRYGGDGDRVALALESDLDAAARAALERALAKLDGDAPWTLETLRAIQARPRVAASKLAPLFGLETAPFKARVVKLKKLGLTQSFEVGYEVSPRGLAWLAPPPGTASSLAVLGRFDKRSSKRRR